MDHTAYDGFVCCISGDGRNDHYMRCNDNHYVNIYELVDKVQQNQNCFLLIFIDIILNEFLHLLHTRLDQIHSYCGLLKEDKHKTPLQKLVVSLH